MRRCSHRLGGVYVIRAHCPICSPPPPPEPSTHECPHGLEIAVLSDCESCLAESKAEAERAAAEARSEAYIAAAEKANRNAPVDMEAVARSLRRLGY